MSGFLHLGSEGKGGGGRRSGGIVACSGSSIQSCPGREWGGGAGAVEAVFKSSCPSSYQRRMHKPTSVLKRLLISLGIWENSFLHLQHGLSPQLLDLICYLHGSLSTPENTELQPVMIKNSQRISAAAIGIRTEQQRALPRQSWYHLPRCKWK